MGFDFYQWEPIKLDSAEVEAKLKGTTLKMKTVAKKMMRAVNKEVLKQAKTNFRNNFNPKNHSYEYDSKYKGTNIKPTLSSFKAINSKQESFVSFVRNYYYVSVFLEYGAVIKPKSQNYLMFKGYAEGSDKKTFLKVNHEMYILKKPFVQPAIDSIYASKAETIMAQTLNNVLKKYWDTDKDIVEVPEDNAQLSV